jgi:hypothetical protein
MSMEPVLKQHRQQLVQKQWKIFQLFDPLEQAGLKGEALAGLYQEASQLIEVVISSRLSKPRGFFVPSGVRIIRTQVQETANIIIWLGMPEAKSALFAWRSALAEAYPSRKAMGLILSDFGQWLQSADPAIRGLFLETLPKIAPLIEHLGTDGVNQILQAGNTLDTSEDRKVFFESIASYGSTTASTVLGICHIAHRALKWKRIDYLKKLEEIIPPERTMESADSSKLIPALAQLSEACVEKGEAFWCQAFDLIFTLAEKNYSSAYAVARDIPKRLGTLPPKAELPYIQDFHRLALTNGIRVVGFGINKLPVFYEKYGLQRTRKFVEATAKVAETYGVTAGQWFYELRTTAARELLVK